MKWWKKLNWCKILLLFVRTKHWDTLIQSYKVTQGNLVFALVGVNVGLSAKSTVDQFVLK